LKVLHLIDSGGLYGAEKVVLNLMEEQIKMGDSPMLLSAGAHEDGEKAIELEARRRNLPVTPWRMKPGLNLRESARIARWAKSNDYRIIHSHGYKFNILMGAQKLAGLSIPLVTTLHGYVNAPRFSKLWVYEKMDGFFLRLTDRVCLVAPHMLDLPMVRRLPENKIAVIENGLPELPPGEQEANLEPELKQFLEGNTFNLLAVGRLSPEKNFSALLRAMAREPLNKMRLGLCIVGEGGRRSELEELRTNLGLESKVRLLGYRNDVPGLMKQFDLLVIPSLTEGLPITLLEAMRAGLAVLSTAVGGIPQVLEQGRAGILVQTNSDNQLFEGIKRAVNDRHNVLVNSRAGIRAFEARYTAVAMAKKYRSAYSVLLGQKKPSEPGVAP
tara:strand:- start:1636 stop:2790 length:1155 start_codon:yes stop_codon:yes gene_type:complete